MAAWRWRTSSTVRREDADSLLTDGPFVARAFNSEHQVSAIRTSDWIIFTSLQMELINECSSRFAEDKDFRLLVRSFLSFLATSTLTAT